MKAAYINSFGGPDVIQYGEVPKPVPAGDEILVRNKIIGVGKPDYLVRSGNDPYLAKDLPGLVIGNESAGIVEEVGPDVKEIRPGDKVAVLNATGCGTHAEYSCSKEQYAIKLPEGVEPEMVPGVLNLQVAYALLFDVGKLSEGDSMYISGAAGGIGTTIVQMAKSAGVHVIASASTERKCDVLRNLGADTVFNYKDADERTEVLEATEGNGADVIFDQTAGKELAGEFDYLADFGQIILYNWLNGSPELPQLETIIKCAWHAQAIRSFSFHVYDNKREKRLANAAKCFDMIRDGRVKPYVCKDFPLAEAKAAHELLDSGRAIGKIIMHP
ncbi:MAG: zinc-binding dehydrogenase [Firmicutes bacterium]|nr:zinc-binding dehydrogenase [Bacillota bacterium]